MLANIDKLLEKYYKNRDESHGINHIKAVIKWCLLIMETIKISEQDKNIILLSAYFHDAFDHKYCDQEEILRIKKNLNQDLEDLGNSQQDINTIFTIIDNISFSKEFNARSLGIKMDLGDIQLLRDIVSDADKIEAVGISGITRMIEFEETIPSQDTDKLTRHIQHIEQHCNEKLYLLLTKGYIKTDFAKKIVQDKIQEMREIVDNRQKLKDFISNELS